MTISERRWSLGESWKTGGSWTPGKDISHYEPPNPTPSCRAVAREPAVSGAVSGWTFSPRTFTEVSGAILFFSLITWLGWQASSLKAQNSALQKQLQDAEGVDQALADRKSEQKGYAKAIKALNDESVELWRNASDAMKGAASQYSMLSLEQNNPTGALSKISSLEHRFFHCVKKSVAQSDDLSECKRLANTAQFLAELRHLEVKEAMSEVIACKDAWKADIENRKDKCEAALSVCGKEKKVFP